MINETRLEHSYFEKLIWRVRIKIGKLIYSFIKPVRDLNLVEKRALVHKARSPGEQLTENEITYLKKYMLDVQDRDLRCEYFKTTPIERTFQGLILPLVEQIISKDPSIKTIVNIGISYAHIDGLLAQKYPQIQFTGVDFASNLQEYNKDFVQPNLNFRSGYAMEMLERQDLEADVFLLSNVAYEIKNAELRKYFRTFIKNGGKYVAITEPIYPLPGGAFVNPLDVPLIESKAVYSHQGIRNSKHGPLGQVHNFKLMLEEAGYSVIYYRCFKPDFTNLRVVTVIAKKTSPLLLKPPHV